MRPRYFRYIEHAGPDGTVTAVHTWRALHYSLSRTPRGRLGKFRWWGYWQARTTLESLASIAGHVVRALRRADDGEGWGIHYEWGAWVVRPRTGWRRIPYLTPALARTRQFPADDEQDHLDWACTRLGIS
jgi:hypothetical protein